MNDVAKLLSAPVNFAVVQLPDRQYPGIVVQGDTLAGYVKQLDRMKSLLDAGELSELGEEIDELSESLSDALIFYKTICADKNQIIKKSG